MEFGKVITPFNVTPFIEKLDHYRDNSEKKVSGLKGNNYFVKIGDDENKMIGDRMNEFLQVDMDWNFEFCHSGEPVGLHTDYKLQPWDEKTECAVLVGIIIPLYWNTKKTPYTINYDKLCEVPRKMIYREGEMRYVDNNEIFHYRDNWKYHESVLEHQPRNTQYIKEYADLKVHSTYEWEIGTMMMFDTKRWHSSSWFIDSSRIESNSLEYKESIVGFGSIDVQRN